MSKRPFKTGFCNPINPADSHARCPVTMANKGSTIKCSCDCHKTDDATDVDPAPSPRAPGLYADVPEADYHGDRGSLSHSGAKLILQAPALFRHALTNPVTKRAWDIGSAAHKLVLGVGDPIVIVQRTDTKSGEVSNADDYKTPSSRQHAEKIRAEHGIPVLRKEYDVVTAMADRLSSHTLAMELLSEGRPEVSAYALDETTKVMLRCRVDWLGPTILTDYKSAESCDPAAFGRKAVDFGYHQQAGWYLDLLRELGHPAEAFAFIVQMKKPPYLVNVIELKPRALDRGRELNRQAIDTYAECMTTGLWPGHVPDTEFASVDLPTWAYYDNDLEISA